MKKFALLAIAVASGGIGCLSGGSKESVLEAFQAKLDAGLTAQERAALYEDGQKLSEMVLRQSGESGGSNSFAKLVFGLDSIEGVLGYLDQRVNYIISYAERFEEHLVELKQDSSENRLEVSTSGREVLGRTLRAEEMARELGQMATSVTALGASKIEDLQTVAANLGTLSWFYAQASKPAELAFLFGDKVIPLDESRVGVVQLGRIYSKRKFFGLGEAQLPSIYRISTLVHEARHSDCTGGVTRSQIDQLIGNGVVLQPSCGHLHGVCPPTHELAGIPACDLHAWGAYAVEAIFSAWVEGSCLNCGEGDKQSAFASALDSLSRVVPMEAMLKGEAGLPDMSSSGVIPEN